MYVYNEINHIGNINMPKLYLSGFLGALPGPKGSPGPQGEQFFLPDSGDTRFKNRIQFNMPDI